MSTYRREPKTFSGRPVPSNYIAGLGRGAVGFTTRSDIGPAQSSGRGGLTDLVGATGKRTVPGHSFGQAPAGYVAGAGRGSGGFGEAKPNADAINADGADFSETNYDAFSGFGGSLFANTQYDKDDEEADRIWESVEKRMDEKRKRQREAKSKRAEEKLRKTRPKIADQFADLKSELSSVRQEEWDSIPEASTGVRNRRQVEKFTPMTDSMLLDSKGKSSTQATEMFAGDGAQSVAPQLGAKSATLSDARNQILQINLDKMSDDVSGQTVVDPKGYLTDLNSLKINSSAEIGDIKKARLLYKSVTSTNPKHAPGWIAAARLEEVAGKLTQARVLIEKGCEACPENEDVWLEAARLQSSENAKRVLARAVKHIPKSVKLWLFAADLETSDSANRTRVLRRALEFIPNSVKLWQALIELEENEDDAKVLLARATECVPHSVEMWLALARLETYDNAKIVLNKARKALPAESRIWIAACRLEEAQGNLNILNGIMKKACKVLSKANVIIDRNTWIKHATDAEDTGAPKTCAAILHATLKVGVEDIDRKRTWVDDAVSCEKSGHIAAARAIFSYTLATFPTEEWIWIKYVALERSQGDPTNVQNVLTEAVSNCPESEVLWLMAAKETWLAGNVPGARGIIQQAFQAGHSSERMWLAAAKLEWENEEFSRAGAVLSKARERASTAKVWMKSALLERELGNYDKEENLVIEALAIFPEFDKLWMMAGQCAERKNEIATARKRYLNGLEKCPHSTPMWMLAAHLEEKYSSVVKARSVLEMSRLKNPRNATLWLQAVRFEERNNEHDLALSLLSKGLQECPHSGELWAEQIFMVPKPEQSAKSKDALTNCDNDAHVILAIAKLFWRNRKSKLAKKWFERAVTVNPDFGDAWGTYYKFLTSRKKSKEALGELVNRCQKADPHHGDTWCKVSKRTENSRKAAKDLIEKVAKEIEFEV
mmetsp:Transcript_12346/g.16002  ORF Transcript_12346/g.16002 Transcript_12346/m.16002 type:complete len:947 (+) Transcript_12346:35-2875(+)